MQIARSPMGRLWRRRCLSDDEQWHPSGGRAQAPVRRSRRVPCAACNLSSARGRRSTGSGSAGGASAVRASRLAAVNAQTRPSSGALLTLAPCRLTRVGAGVGRGSRPSRRLVICALRASCCSLCVEVATGWCPLTTRAAVVCGRVGGSTPCVSSYCRRCTLGGACRGRRGFLPMRSRRRAGSTGCGRHRTVRGTRGRPQQLQRMDPPWAAAPFVVVAAVVVMGMGAAGALL